MFRPAPAALLLGLIFTASTVSAQGYHAQHHQHGYDVHSRYSSGTGHLHGDYHTGHGHLHQEDYHYDQEDYHHDHNDSYQVPQRLNREYCPRDLNGYDAGDYPAYDQYQSGPDWDARQGQYYPEQEGRYGRQNPGQPGYQQYQDDYPQGQDLPYDPQQLPGQGYGPGYGPQTELDQYPQYDNRQPEQYGKGLNSQAPYYQGPTGQRNQGPLDSRQYNNPQRYPSQEQYQGQFQDNSAPEYGPRIPDRAILGELPTPPEVQPELLP